MDLEIRKFEASLVAHINHNRLPVEIKRLVLFEIYKQVSEAADDVVNEQQKAEKQKVIHDIHDKEVNKDAEIL